MCGRSTRMRVRSSRMSRGGREALPDIREWLGGLRISGSDREALPDVR